MRTVCGGKLLLLCGLTAIALLGGCAPGSPRPPSAPPSGAVGDFARGVDVGGRQVYLECQGTNAPGNLTIILISGYHDSGDAWSINEIITPPAAGPAVPVALARDHRVCVYDRPGTLRYTLNNNPLTERSTPVPQPRTAAQVVTELHAVLNNAQVPGPYILTAHSLGGLFARLYAQTYPEQVRGIVFVDAFSATVPAVFGSKWPLYRGYLNAAPPGTQLADPTAEKIDLDASVAQTLAGPPLRPMPIVVLTKTEPFQTSLAPPAGLTSDELNRSYEVAETDLVKLEPNTPQTFATGSAHYVQWQAPDLVTTAAELVNNRITAAPR